MDSLRTDYTELLHNRNVCTGLLNGKCMSALEALEVATSRKREEIIAVGLGLLACYLVFGDCAQLVCNLTACVYPVYASFKAMRTGTKEHGTLWMTYWCVFAFMSLIDFYSDAIMSVFPFYFLIKCIGMFWLYAPPIRGAVVLYVQVIGPVMFAIDQWLAAGADTNAAN